MIMAENRIFKHPFPGMDPGFEQFCAISEKDFIEMIRTVRPGKPDAVCPENKAQGKHRSVGHSVPARAE